MFHRKMLAACALAIGLGAPLAAFAKTADMTALDPDNDGTVSLDEASKAGAAKFDKLDVDHDGTIDKTEAASVIPEKMFDRINKDKDGTIDKAEYGDAVAAVFKRADKDNDGTIDAAELAKGPGKRLVKMIQ
jgi:hypothetical protein